MSVVCGKQITNLLVVDLQNRQGDCVVHLTPPRFAEKGRMCPERRRRGGERGMRRLNAGEFQENMRPSYVESELMARRRKNITVISFIFPLVNEQENDLGCWCDFIFISRVLTGHHLVFFLFKVR